MGTEEKRGMAENLQTVSLDKDEPERTKNKGYMSLVSAVIHLGLTVAPT